MLHQLASAYMTNACEYPGLMANAGSLSEAEFIVDSAAELLGGILKGPHPELEVLIEDENADLFAMLTFGICWQRLQRGAWMFGWPVRMYAILGADDRAINTEQKNNSALKAFRRSMKPVTSISVWLSNGLLSNLHRFSSVVVDTLSAPRSARLPGDAFSPAPGQASIDLSGMVSVSAAPSWWSPSASNLTTQHADIPLVNQAMQGGDDGIFKRAWVGELCRLQHRIMLGFIRPGQQRVHEWVIPLHWFPRSCVLVWPCTKVSVHGSTDFYFEPRLDVGRPDMRPVTDLHGRTTVAVQIQWKSWLGQVHLLKKKAERAVGPQESLARVMYRCAGWELSRSTLMGVAKELQVNIDSTASLCELLCHLCKTILWLNDKA